VASKDKGGAKAGKKVAQRSLKEKRQAKKQRTETGQGISIGR
jgi:hypothetical protein